MQIDDHRAPGLAMRLEPRQAVGAVEEPVSAGGENRPLGPPLRTISASEFAGDSAGVRVRFEGDGPKATVIRSRFAGTEVSGTRLPDGG